MSETLNLTSDEKLMGVAAHMFGPMVAILIWATQKDKSPFAKFQSLQALAFDLLLIIVGGISFFFIFVVMILGMSWTMFTVIESPSPDSFKHIFALPFIFPLLIFTCVTPMSIGILVLRLIASVTILNGRNYKYPIIGKWLENSFK